jgi:hypothetical protein
MFRVPKVGRGWREHRAQQAVHRSLAILFISLLIATTRGTASLETLDIDERQLQLQLRGAVHERSYRVAVTGTVITLFAAAFAAFDDDLPTDGRTWDALIVAAFAVLGMLPTLDNRLEHSRLTPAGIHRPPSTARTRPDGWTQTVRPGATAGLLRDGLGSPGELAGRVALEQRGGQAATVLAHEGIVGAEMVEQGYQGAPGEVVAVGAHQMQQHLHGRLVAGSPDVRGRGA